MRITTFTALTIAAALLLTACNGGGTGSEGGAGEISITSLDSNRVKGTFRGVIKPSAGKPATSSLEILEGTFDVGFGT